MVGLWEFIRHELVLFNKTTDSITDNPFLSGAAVSRHLWTTLFVGWGICLDSFLFLLTFLPLRVIGFTLHLLRESPAAIPTLICLLTSAPPGALILAMIPGQRKGIRIKGFLRFVAAWAIAILAAPTSLASAISVAIVAYTSPAEYWVLVILVPQLPYIRYLILVLMSFLHVRHELITSMYVADISRIIIIGATILILSKMLQLPLLYHTIRAQSMFKLYVIINIIQILERLCCSVGEDMFDLLFATVDEVMTSKRPRLYLYLHILMCTLYNVVHAIVLLTYMISINVAINSNDTSLIVLLVSNNFVELKTNVFKRFSKANLFQVTASDIVEWFHLTLFWGIITVRNLEFLGWAKSWATQSIWAALSIFGMELVVDWMKHSFITRFNGIRGYAYSEFHTLLSWDVVSYRSNQVSSDEYVLSRRLGFVCVPLCCVSLYSLSGVFTRIGYGCIPLFGAACLLKVVVSIVLVGHCSRRVQVHKVADDMRTVHRFSMIGKTIPKH